MNITIMARVLITGVNGFIGTALRKRLTSDGHHVIGTSRNPEQEGGTIRVSEINGETDWGEALRNVDVVVHLAARAHITNEKSLDSFSLFERTNHYGTKQLADECVKYGVKRFIYISSIGVNGASTDKAFSEDSEPSPEEPYAVSKFNAEKALNKIANVSGLETVIIRPPLVYGPGAKGNFLRLLKLVKYSIPLPIGNIENKRSMIGLTNFVDIISKIIVADKITRRLYLVSDGYDLSTSDFVKKIATRMHRKTIIYSFPQSIIKFLVRLVGKQREYMKLTSSLVINSTALREELDWVPVSTLDQELDSAISQFKEGCN